MHHDIHGFSVNLLESHPSNLRFRSVQFGSSTVVSLLLGEVDCTLEQLKSESSTEEDVYIIVGSDEGFTEATLLRIAALLNEVCIFLHVGPKTQQNLYLLRMVMQYIDMRLGMADLGFLSESIEAVFNPAITATGYSSNPKGLLDELVRANIFDGRADDERMPGYCVVLFGNKILMETSGQIADEAAKMNDIDKFSLSDSDRYLIYLVTSAFFAVPHPRANKDREAREHRILELERRLMKFEVHRHNVTRSACREVISKYCTMLRSLHTQGVDERSAADFYWNSFEELLEYMSAYPTAESGGERNRYHCPEMDLRFLESELFTIQHCCFRSSEHLGTIQLLWAPSPKPLPEEYAMADLCPMGYGLCVVYFPPRNDKESTKVCDFPSLVPIDPLRTLANEVLGSVEMSFNRFQWLLSPPVESYETPGLIHFLAVDRKDNSCVCGSFERMMHQKPAEVQRAVRELQSTMAQCMSKAHELIGQGFSEGLWGHLGMQFFFSIGVAPATTQEGTTLGQGIRSATATQEGGSSVGLFGASDAKKIPSSVVPHVLLRPMLISDFCEEQSKQIRVVEIYCMFIGCMSPQEVCQSVEWLRSSRLFA
jgi:hypothetical protein